MVTGYFANWKMFDPRKLIPLSMEFCSAPIAVITQITENTPMVIPVMVKAARSLFAPSEDNAILMMSPNNMSIEAEWRRGVMEWWSNHRPTITPLPPALRYSALIHPEAPFLDRGARPTRPG